MNNTPFNPKPADEPNTASTNVENKVHEASTTSEPATQTKESNSSTTVLPMPAAETKPTMPEVEPATTELPKEEAKPEPELKPEVKEEPKEESKPEPEPETKSDPEPETKSDPVEKSAAAVAAVAAKAATVTDELPLNRPTAAFVAGVIVGALLVAFIH